MNRLKKIADTNKNRMNRQKGVVRTVSAKQRTIVIFAILFVILLAAGLIIYSVSNTGVYDGVFVNGVRQVVL